MDENPAYGTKTSLRGQAYENTPEEPSYEIIPASCLQSTSTDEHTTAQWQKMNSMHDYRYIVSLILKQSYVVITDNTDGIECLHYWDKLGYVTVLLIFINELIIMWKDHACIKSMET